MRGCCDCYTVVLLSALSPLFVPAKPYLVKPICVLIGSPPGGGEDFHARTVTSKMIKAAPDVVNVSFETNWSPGRPARWA